MEIHPLSLNYKFKVLINSRVSVHGSLWGVLSVRAGMIILRYC